MGIEISQDNHRGGAPVGNNLAVKWTPEHDAALVSHRDDGYSSSQNAQLINQEFQTVYSRNAVIGRLHRLGLTDANSPRKSPQIASPRKLREVKAPRARPVKPVLPAEIIRLRCAEITPLHVELAALDADACRYPFGDGPFTFCGNLKLESSSYCFAHYHLTRGTGTASERAATRVETKLLATV